MSQASNKTSPNATSQDTGPQSQASASADRGSVELLAKDLPAFCPNKKMAAWSGHPKVFLDVTHGDGASCPYCGTHYRLKAGEVVKGH